MSKPGKPGRLKKRPDFLKAAASGRKWVAPGMIVQARPHGDVPTGCRIGFTVSKKVGNAVMRNRARRRLRAVVDETLKSGDLPACDLVLIGRVNTIGRPYGDLRNDFREAFRRLTGIAVE